MEVKVEVEGKIREEEREGGFESADGGLTWSESTSPSPGRPPPSWLQAGCCLQGRPWSF